MNDFFEGMSGLMQTYWIIAILGSGVFAIIFIMTFIGGGDADMDTDGTDFDADDGGVGFQFFTFKNVIAFFTIFGWTGIICLGSSMSGTMSIIIATIAGLSMMVLTSLMFFWINKMAASGTLKINNAVGVIGEVYIPIGAKRSTVGKVQINVQGSLRELEAITDAVEDLKTNTMIRVSSVISGEILLVEKLSN